MISAVTYSWKGDKFIFLSLIFILSGVYFLLFANHIFFYQENRILFVFSSEYLCRFISKPGGLLEYAGNFITQGYFNNIYGSAVQALLFTAVAAVFLKINNRISPGRSFSLLFASLVSCSLFLMQTNINYRIHNNLGFLLAGIYFLISIYSGQKVSRILVPVMFPFFST